MNCVENRPAFYDCRRAALTAAAIVAILSVRIAQAELVFEFLDSNGNPIAGSPIQWDTENAFLLRSNRIRIVDNGLFPTPSTTVLSFSQTLDRATLDGAPEADRFWTFTVNASADYVKNPDGSLAGVQNLRFFLFGQHLKGHSGTVNPNGLGLISTEPAITENAGKDFVAFASKIVKHAHTDGTHGDDYYAVYVQSKVGDSTLNPLGNADKLNDLYGNLRVHGSHLDRPPSWGFGGNPPKRVGMTFGSSESFVGYDANTGKIILSPDQNDTALFQPPPPGQTGGAVDPQFAADPLVAAFSTMLFSTNAGSYLGFDADRGLHVFSGGMMSVANFGAADYTLSATFDEMLYDPASGDFFVMMDSTTFTDRVNSPPSDFLALYLHAHLLGDDPNSLGTMFTFNMPGLVQATTGFSTSFFSEVPVGMYMTGIQVPEPSSVALLGVGAVLTLLFAARRRSLANRHRLRYPKRVPQLRLSLQPGCRVDEGVADDLSMIASNLFGNRRAKWPRNFAGFRIQWRRSGRDRSSGLSPAMRADAGSCPPFAASRFL